MAFTFDIDAPVSTTPITSAYFGFFGMRRSSACSEGRPPPRLAAPTAARASEAHAR